MSEIAGIFRVLEHGYRELAEAFDGLADENVWKRPGANLLSVGEIAGHMAQCEATMLTGPGPSFEATPVSVLPIKSWLLRDEFKYPPITLQNDVVADVTARTAAEVHAELKRVHDEAAAFAKGRDLGPDDHVSGWPEDHKWGPWLTYAAFHVAYHTGQIYLTRHLLGEATPDN
jgi:uncharacterized damage-inducible protein DinB